MMYQLTYKVNLARAALLLLIVTMVRTNLNILQWNARGLGAAVHNSTTLPKNSKINNLNKLIHDLNFPDVICIQEPLIKNNHVLNFPNYNLEIIFKGTGCRGLLTMIKKTHTYKVLKSTVNKYITSHTLEIHIQNQTKIHVTNYYRNWENKNQDIRDNRFIETVLGHPLKQNLSAHFIVGDMNAHHNLWGSDKNTKIGKIYAKIIESPRKYWS